ncbi:reprolysin-like metallopeptidase [Aquirhabdus sp.]|uniref:reprolysin-like metallopeptidase n=1 Tax=Aquirhabdus sp. TaxID=2824160 RepID=UPI00396CE947
MKKSTFILTSLLCSITTSLYAAPLFSPAFSSNSDALLQSSQSKQLAIVLKDPAVKSYSLVKIDLNALTQPNVGVNVAASDISATTSQTIIKRSSTNYSWFGKTSDGNTIISVNGNAVEGIIHKRSKVYHLRSLGNGLQALVEVDQSKYPSDEPLGIKIPSGKVANPKNTATKSAIPITSSDGVVPPVAADNPVIDVLVAYTPSVKALYTDDAGVLAHVQLAIDDANQTYLNSAINSQLRLVDTQAVNYAGSSNLNQDLNDLVGTTDGNMDDIHARLNTTGADITVLLVASDVPASCGLAYVGANTTAYAFGVVEDSCAIGNHSFAHEIGHLYGANHDVANSGTGGIAYAHGYHYLNEWRTVMAYPSACSAYCPRIPYWSNPNILTTDSMGATKPTTLGIAMGTVATENNAKVLTDNAGVLQGLRAHKNWNCFNVAKKSLMSFISQGTTLCPLDTITSPNGQYKLSVLENGNLAVTNSLNSQIWSSATTPIDPAVPKTEIRAVLEPTGNFAIYDRGDTVKWSTGTTSTSASLRMQDDGNVVLYAVQIPFSSSYSDPLAGSSAKGPYILSAGQTLASNQSGLSGNGKYKIRMLPSGNLIVTRVSDIGIVFSAGTTGNGNRAVMQADGNFVIYNTANKALWSTKTSGLKGASARLQDDGKFVIYSSGPKWSSKTGLLK